MIERQVEQLGRLVDDLLDVSRITRGQISLKVAPLDLGTVISRALEVSRPSIDAGRHELDLELPEEPVSVEGDLVRLTQIVANLLTNAAKFQDPQGRITIRVERSADDAVIRIRDQGIGMTPEVLTRAFDMFMQPEPVLERPAGGLGIGLALVKKLVEMHGGSVAALSDGPGRGSEFVVRLPSRSPEAGSELRPAHATPVPLRPAIRVLVVDDNPDAADSLALLLKTMGHEVSLAHDGPSALEIAAVTAPEVVLLDIRMPEMDGFEVCRKLREQGLTEARIVAVTGFGQEQDRQRSLAVGFDAHAVKPVDATQLISLLEGGRGRSSTDV